MTTSKIDLIRALLKGIETGDPASVEVINPNKYIQHNLQTHEGRDGLAALFKRLSKTNPRVNIVRAFEDGDYIFAHTEYDFATRRIGFEVFRFEDGLTVEHWDNIQARKGPNVSGHSMVDGPTEAVDLELTEANRGVVTAFVETVLVSRQRDKASDFIDTGLIQHDPYLADGAGPWLDALEAAPNGNRVLQFDRVHRVLAQGSFVLSVSEGYFRGAHSALYDLYRLAGGRIVEHWNTIETVAPTSEWKNNNGKF